MIGAVAVWGLAIAGAGFMPSIWPAALLLAIAGAADSISAVCRSIINQTVTPEELRGRMSATFMLVVTSGPRLGDLESGIAASLTTAGVAVVSGGLACVVGHRGDRAAVPGADRLRRPSDRRLLIALALAGLVLGGLRRGRGPGGRSGRRRGDLDRDLVVVLAVARRGR